jgi:hypothetical protein
MTLAVVLAAMISGLSTAPASADDRSRNDQHHAQAHRRPVRSDRHDAPQYVYAPPPVYYAAPERQPAIDLVFPLEFR